MSSVAGRFGYANRSPYCAAKWGIIGFTKTLSIELGEYGIRADAILPGAVDGPRIQKVFEGRAKTSMKSTKRRWRSSLSKGLLLPSLYSSLRMRRNPFRDRCCRLTTTCSRRPDD